MIPLKDTVTLQLADEQWKEIPDFEGLYHISNYGRVRSLSRWVYSANRPDAYRPGRIIKLRFTPGSSKRKQNTTEVEVQMKLHREGKRFQMAVARYVYFLFVRKFDLTDYSLIVRKKDGNSLNCHVSNLFLSNLSDVAKEGFALNKRRSKFQEQVKPVHQYTLDGKFVASYPFAKAASVATQIPSEYINGAASTKRRTAGGFYWRYGKAFKHINTRQYAERRRNVERTRKRKVQQLDKKTGLVIRTFDSVTEAVKALGIGSRSQIAYACKSEKYSCIGFRWRYV